MADVKPKDLHIRWAWVPAAIFVVALSWHRRGVLVTVLLVLAGLALGYYVNRRARRRQERGEMD
jgi:Flp pilus assembly protein TadB